MASTTTTGAVAKLKETDGAGHLEGFPAYFEDRVMVYDEHGRHRSGAPLDAVIGATERRKLAVCELLGIDGAEYDRRAAAFVARLLAKHADLAGLEAAREHALSFASHVALARALLAPKAVPVEGVIVVAAVGRAAPGEAKAARLAGPRKVSVARARRSVLVRDVERVRAEVEAALFRAGRLAAA